MSYSPESIYNSYLALTAKPDGKKVKLFVDTFVKCLQRNDMKILTNNDNFTVNNIITIIFDTNKFDRVFTSFDPVFDFEMIEENKYLSRKLFDNKKIHLLVHVIFAKDVQKYAKSNNYEIVSFSESGSIYNYARMKKTTDEIFKELSEFIYHPKRIEKHLMQGRELEEYLS